MPAGGARIGPALTDAGRKRPFTGQVQRGGGIGKPRGCAGNAEHRAKACTEQRLLLIQNAKPQVEGKRTKAAVQPDAGERIGATLLALCLPGDCFAAFECRCYRSEEGRGGKECERKCRSRGWPKT